MRSARSVVRGTKYEVRSARYEVRGTRYKLRGTVRGTRYEVRRTRYEVRGTRYVVRGTRYREWRRRYRPSVPKPSPNLYFFENTFFCDRSGKSLLASPFGARKVVYLAVLPSCATNRVQQEPRVGSAIPPDGARPFFRVALAP